jgi:hypothetical protein
MDYAIRGMSGTRGRGTVRGSFILIVLLGVVFNAGAAGTKEEDFRKAEGTENWESQYDISKLPPGKYNLLIEGKDKAGNVSTAGPYNVYVDPKSDLPVTGISNPTAGIRVGGDLNIVGTCVDDDGVDRVEIKIDGGDWIKAEGKDYWSYILDVSTVADGKHTVSAHGIDINGVTGDPVSVVFNLDTIKPLVKITSHTSGTLASGTIKLMGTAEDANGIKNLFYSPDNKKTYAELPLRLNQDRTSAQFDVTLDTRRLADGPYVYWFKATDLMGSVGYTAFLIFADNTGPALDVIKPKPDEKLSGKVNVSGKITERIGVKSFTYEAGEGNKGSIDLIPGNPYWIKEFDFSKLKASSTRIVFTVTDLAGNVTTKQVPINFLDEQARLPVLTLRSPAAGGRYGGDILLSGALRDDAGVKAVAYSIDGKPFVTLESKESFASLIPSVAPGKHRIAVHGIDTEDRAGKDTALEFTSTGLPPSVTLVTLATGKGSATFKTGAEIVRGEGVSISGIVNSLSQAMTVEASLNGAAAEKISPARSDKAGIWNFSVRIPPTVAFGAVTLSVRATDEFGQTGEAKSVFHVTNYAKRNIEPGVYFEDSRIGADGMVTLHADETLWGFMAEEDIESAVLEPATTMASLSWEGDRISIVPQTAGTSDAVHVKVTTTRKHVFKSADMRFVCDGVPAPGTVIKLGTIGSGKDAVQFYPGMRVVPGASPALSGTVVIPGGLKSAEYSIQGKAAQSLSLNRKSEKSLDYTFSIQLPSDLPYGRIGVRISVIDAAGARTEYSTAFYRTEKEPEGTRDEPGLYVADARIDSAGSILMAPGEALTGWLNGRSLKEAKLEPASPLVEVGFDGRLITVSAVKEGIVEKARIRAVNVDGDAFVSDAFTIRIDAEKPAMTLESPVTGGWIGKKLHVKGTVSDANGVRSLEYALSSAPDTFIPITLAAAKTGSAPSFDLSLDLEGQGDGDIGLSLRALDAAGRQSELVLWMMKDTKEPVLTLLTPPADDAVNGIVTLVGTAADEGIIDRVEFSQDGKAYVPANGTDVFSVDLDLSKLAANAAISYRAVDRSGNTAVLSPKLNIQQATDVPEVQIQIPQDGEVLRGDFTISGMVFDDDGVGSISYRMDNAEFSKIAGSNSFSIPVLLKDIADNEHTIEVKAEDLNGVPSVVRKSVFKISKAEPVSKLVAPTYTTTNRGIITLNGESSDKNGIREVFVSFDNGQTYDKAEGKDKWTYRLNTAILKDGTYSLFVKAVDNYDTEGFHTTLLNVDNTVPEIALDSPVDGSSVAESLVLDGRAVDNIALTSLKASLSPLAPGSKPAAAVFYELPRKGIFSYTIDLKATPTGWYNLSLQGIDRAENAANTSRNIYVQEKKSVDRVDVMFPVNGETVTGNFTIAGRVRSTTAVAEAAILVDGKSQVSVPVNANGYFSTEIKIGTILEGDHTIGATVQLSGDLALTSEPRQVTYRAVGPWVRISSHSLGDFINSRPYIKGQAGYALAPFDPADKEAAAKAQKELQAHRIDRVEVSVDNGKSFFRVDGAESWQFRLQSQDYPDGEIRLMAKAFFIDGTYAVDETVLDLDDTPPQVVLLTPSEEGRFNTSVTMTGTAHDANGIAQVRAVVRAGDKANYEVPAFIQGLYFDGHGLGATTWDFGAGLTFFDNAVRLQAQIGLAPQFDYFTGNEQAFYGWCFGAKLLASIFKLPFNYFLGPDWDFLSLSCALGANFTYVTNTNDFATYGKPPAIIGSVVGQLEFPIIKNRGMSMFNTYSAYIEYQLWFFSSDVAARLRNQIAFGLRIGVF